MCSQSFSDSLFFWTYSQKLNSRHSEIFTSFLYFFFLSCTYCTNTWDIKEEWLCVRCVKYFLTSNLRGTVSAELPQKSGRKLKMSRKNRYAALSGHSMLLFRCHYARRRGQNSIQAAALLPPSARNTPAISRILATLKNIRESTGHSIRFWITRGGSRAINASP